MNRKPDLMNLNTLPILSGVYSIYRGLVYLLYYKR